MDAERIFSKGDKVEIVNRGSTFQGRQAVVREVDGERGLAHLDLLPGGSVDVWFRGEDLYKLPAGEAWIGATVTLTEGGPRDGRPVYARVVSVQRGRDMSVEGYTVQITGQDQYKHWPARITARVV